MTTCLGIHWADARSIERISCLDYKIIICDKKGRVMYFILRVLCKFTRKKLISFGCHLTDGVIRGGPPPTPSDVTEFINKL